MQEELAKKISIFDSIFGVSPKETTIGLVLDDIKTGFYQKQVEKCREAIREADFKTYNSLKTKLPAVTFSGMFSEGRTKSNLQTYSQFIILDFDKLERIDLFEKDIVNDPFVFAAWLSPSATGYKVLIRLSSSVNEHLKAFDALVDYFNEKYAYSVDISGSDVSRLCIVSFDPQMHVNPSAQFWSTLKYSSPKLFEFQKKPAESTTTNSTPLKSFKKIFRFLKQRNLSITTSYEEWYKVALALSSTFEYEQALKLFLDLSRLDGVNHSEEKSIAMFDYCYRNNKNLIGFGTLIFLAKQKGFVL